MQKCSCRFSSQDRRRWGESCSQIRETRYTGAMPADDPAAPPADEAPVRRRDLAVARSLDSARVRSEGRVQRFLDAGFELLASAESGKEFTVQEVVDRSGQSLRSFYQYFAGKHELLLALFDEAIRSTAERLEEQIAKEDAPARPAAPLRRRVLPHVPAGSEGPRLEEQPDAGHGGVLPPAADGAPGARRPGPSSRWSPCSRRSWPTRSRPESSARAVEHARMPPASSCRRSCSTPPTPRPSAAPSRRDGTRAAEQMWEFISTAS